MFVYKDKKFTQEQVEQAAKNANLTVDEYLKANTDITIVVDDPLLKKDFDWSSWKGDIDSLTDEQYEAFYTYGQNELYKRYPNFEEQQKANIKKLESMSADQYVNAEKNLENKAAFKISEEAIANPKVYAIVGDLVYYTDGTTATLKDHEKRFGTTILNRTIKNAQLKPISEIDMYMGGVDAAQKKREEEQKTATIDDPTESIGNSVENAVLQLAGLDDRMGVLWGTLTDNKKLIAKSIKEINKLNSYQQPTIGYTDIPEADGIIEKMEYGIAALSNSVTSLLSSYLPARLTFGATIVSDMVGASIVDYNQQKAESQGVTLGELYENGENEILIPTVLGGFGVALERIGFKGITSYINKMPMNVKKEFFALFSTGTKEGVTEFLQFAVETFNTEIAKIDNAEKNVMPNVLSNVYSTVFSKEGIEVFLQGFTGAATYGRLSRPFGTKNTGNEGDQTVQDDTTPPDDGPDLREGSEPSSPPPPPAAPAPVVDNTVTSDGTVEGQPRPVFDPSVGDYNVNTYEMPKVQYKIPDVKVNKQEGPMMNRIQASANLRPASQTKKALILVLNMSNLETTKQRKNLAEQDVALINNTILEKRNEVANIINANNQIVESLSEQQVQTVNEIGNNIVALKSEKLTVKNSNKFTKQEKAEVITSLDNQIQDENQKLYNIRNEAEIALDEVVVTAKDKSTANELASNYDNLDAKGVQDLLKQYQSLALSALGYSPGKGTVTQEDAIAFVNAEFSSIMDRFDPSKSQFSTWVTNNIAPKAKSLYGEQEGLEKAGQTTSLDDERAQQVADPSTVETTETVTETVKPTVNVFGKGPEGETLESQTVGAIQESELGRKIQSAETVEISDLNTLNEEVSAPILAEELNIPVEVITDPKINILKKHNPSNIQRYILKNAQLILSTLKANTNVEVVGSLKNPEVKIKVGGKPLKLPRKLLDLFFEKTNVRVNNNFQYKLKKGLTLQDIIIVAGIPKGKIDPNFEFAKSGEMQAAKALLLTLSRIRTNAALEGITTGEVAGTILSATPAKAKTATERAIDYLTEQEKKFKGVLFSGVPINKVFTVAKGAVKLLNKGIKAGKKLPQVIAQVKKYIQNKLKQFGVKFSNNVANTFIDVYEKTGDYNKAVNAVINSINSSIPSSLYNINVVDLKVMSPLLKKLGAKNKQDPKVKKYIKENIVPLLKNELTLEQKVLVAYTLQGTGKNKVDDNFGQSGMVYARLSDALKALGISKDEYNSIKKNNPEIIKALQFAGTSVLATSKLKLEILNDLKNNKDLQTTVQEENKAKLKALDDLITTLVKIVQKNPESADGIIHMLGLQSDYQGHFIRRLIPLVSFTDPSLLEKGTHDEHYSKSLATTRYIQQIIEFASKDVTYDPSNDITALKKGVARGVVSSKEGDKADGKKGTGKSRLISQQPIEEVYNIVENPNLHWVLPNTEMNPSNEIKTLEIVYAEYKANQVIEDGEQELETPEVQNKLNEFKKEDDKDLSKDFNTIIEENKGVKADARYSDIAARREGRGKGRFKFFLPPGAEDFKGLIYTFLGKGKIGEKQFEFFDNNLIKPYQQAVAQIETFRRTLKLDYSTLLKGSPEARVLLNKKIPTKGKTDFTYDQAVRAYLMDQSGFDLTDAGLSKRDAKLLVDTIKNNPIMASFAQGLQLITKQDTWLSPNGGFDIQTIQSDLHRLTSGEGRKRFLDNSGFMQNSGEIFSKDNLNKIEATYGKGVREAIEDMMYRMKNGTNRPSGNNRLTNQFNNWVNRSIGAIMFFNRKSALLQTISSINFINWSDNNPLKAAAAFANQKQYWSDFARIFNSAKLKERRAGLKGDINEAELADAVKGATNKAEAALSWLLKKGFLPTQMADSFAIASGGASFYRNRINTYKKQGLSDVEAEKKAFEDFSRISEESQQSADPSMISEQQASPLGRLILAFQNTPMQYTRLMKRAAQDLVAGRGDAKTHVSKIIYYGAVQNFMFAALSNALFAVIPGFGDDDDEEEVEDKSQKKYVRIANNMVDTVLRGSGIYGAIGATLKNTLVKFYQNEGKDPFAKDNADIILEAVNLSPPIGSKLRKLNNALKTREYEKDVIEERGWEITRDGRLNLSPSYRVLGSTAEAVANIPLERIIAEISALTEMTDSRNSSMERIALGLGWRTWDLGIRNEEEDQIKVEAKERKKQERKDKLQKEREEKKRLKEEKRFEGLTPKEINNLKRKDQIEVLTKQQQIDSLIKLGVSKKDIRSLRLESDRIDKIIEINNK
mgnify:FL=1